MTNTKLKKNTPNIQLVGCAKDEAAYLSEWIFYHLDIGFNSIKIYINNTTDNSTDVLDKIIKKHPEVSYVVADELINNPPAEYKDKTNDNFYNTNGVQSIVYTDVLFNRKSDTDYIAFLDIDEFFLPKKPLNEIFSSDLSNVMSQRFKWLLLSGDNKDFCNLSECTKGFMDDSFKSVVPNRDIDIRSEDPHRFSINGDIGPFNDDAIVLHRVLRSKKEYLNLLSKSTSNQKNKLANGFKRNRRGWTNKGRNIKELNTYLNENYNDKLLQFIEFCEVGSDIAIARQRILSKYTVILSDLEQINQQNIDLIRSLSGTSISHVSIVKTALLNSFWSLVRIISPRLVLSHESIKDAILSKITLKKKQS